MNIAPSVLANDIVMVPLNRIPVDEGSQTRVKSRAALVRDYAAAMTAQVAEGGLRFPPVILFTDGEAYWVGDGFHRILAAGKAGLTEIAAQLRPGSQREALLFGICANNEHGLPRTSADKRKAVALLLADPEWSQWSDREIARRCQVGNTLVSCMRRGSSVRGAQITRKVERAGTVYEMNKQPQDPVTAASVADPPSAPVPATDPLGIPVPEPRANVFGALGDFQEAHNLFDQLTRLLDRIAQGPGGTLYRQEMFLTKEGSFVCTLLRLSRNKLVAAEPYCSYCPNCQPTHPTKPNPTCKKCGGRGWTTRAAFDSCVDSARQHILSLRG